MHTRTFAMIAAVAVVTACNAGRRPSVPLEQANALPLRSATATDAAAAVVDCRRIAVTRYERRDAVLELSGEAVAGEEISQLVRRLASTRGLEHVSVVGTDNAGPNIAFTVQVSVADPDAGALDRPSAWCVGSPAPVAPDRQAETRFPVRGLLTLVATIGDRAMVADAQGKGFIVHAGDSLADGWKVERIEATQVILAHTGTPAQRVLRLK